MIGFIPRHYSYRHSKDFSKWLHNYGHVKKKNSTSATGKRNKPTHNAQYSVAEGGVFGMMNNIVCCCGGVFELPSFLQMLDIPHHLIYSSITLFNYSFLQAIKTTQHWLLSVADIIVIGVKWLNTFKANYIADYTLYKSLHSRRLWIWMS